MRVLFFFYHENLIPTKPCILRWLVPDNLDPALPLYFMLTFILAKNNCNTSPKNKGAAPSLIILKLRKKASSLGGSTRE